MSFGAQDRFALSPMIVIESTFAGRCFEIDIGTDRQGPMVYTPETQSGSFFNDQEREVRSLQWVETLSFSMDRGQGSICSSSALTFRIPATTARASAAPWNPSP